MDENKKNNGPESTGKMEVDTGFMKEQIKQRPVNKKKIVKTTLGTAGLAVLFGGIACVVFLLLQPVFSKMITEESAAERVTFSEDIKTEEISPEELALDDDELLVGEGKTSVEETVSGDQFEQSVEQVLENRSVSAADYQKIYSMLDDIAVKAYQSMVVVTGITSDYNWFNEAYESSNKASGLILADNGVELLILTPTSAIRNAKSIRITFPDGTQLDAETKSSDKNAKMAVVSVQDSEIPDSTRASFLVAELGSSRKNRLTGTPIIALGSVTGEADSTAYGMITGSSKTLDAVDSTAKLLTTDIYGSTNASGILVNLSGQVIGILDMEYNSDDMKNLISAIGISDIKPLIEKLSNGGKKPYLGIYGADVPEDVENELSIPKGVYIRKVETESPAMGAGLLSGDVITELGGEEVTSLEDYVTVLTMLDPGSEVTVKFSREGVSGYEKMSTTATLSEEP